MRHEDSNSKFSTDNVAKKISFMSNDSNDNNTSKLKSRVPFSKDFQGGLFPITVLGFSSSNYYKISDQFKKIGSYSNIDHENDANWFVIYYNKEEDSQEALKLSMSQLPEGQMVAVYSHAHEGSLHRHSTMNMSFTNKAMRLPRKSKNALRQLLEYVCIWW
jgi:hypothetical protein